VEQALIPGNLAKVNGVHIAVLLGYGGVGGYCGGGGGGHSPVGQTVLQAPICTGEKRVWYSHKVLTTVEYRAVSGVFQNIDPPPSSPPSECVHPPHQRRGYTLAGRRGGWGVNILEDARHRIGLLQYNLSTGIVIER
jgi:hypothetical protein